ncbi:hypothetical protein A2X44_04920 [candidate division CPR3 bacterium GWF2_35_18]|uniref:Uncharacterized protein n=1 Tax=candidate division CPR3 bacterium GW2011_GWF2_35_18 TaxID=1618350 RepID=A0A0G0BK29_UNCC3|nr:MAG: hypothetical protein UR67_C0003G0066 [candidate division CPR3 bacterium GW2011_GWF2_35_18]OGB63676.1 MAG: hypothetical protein A2X44_04920 [candidate division CPR3 bacterium GWF2_35_18]OGB65003.1 MAG: hypothetical protein A2250_01120 [candidate division CPR3 bacterium RIFOXYA2_FULL_35_13]OGB79121.1 MAG: hypothetical protein A2296_04415 [candidate division CPR3 bacterium RIFOXYB2_FULL_35_8]
MNAYAIRRLTPAISILIALVAVIALLSFADTQNATAAQTVNTITVEAILNPEMDLLNEGFEAGSPINHLYADNQDGIHAYGEGIVTRSDGYTWTLSMDNDQAFLSPINDLYIITDGIITETWTFTVTNETPAKIVRNDAFFTVYVNSPAEVQVNQPFDVEFSITNIGNMTATVSLRAPWGQCGDRILIPNEVFTLTDTMVLTETGQTEIVGMIAWAEYRLQDYNQIIISDQIVPVTWVQIAGPLNGYIGEEITLTAMTNVTATNNVTYHFTATDLGEIEFYGLSLGVQQALVWETPGEKVIEVAATNVAGNVVSDTMTVTVISPAPTTYQIFIPLAYKDYTPPTVIDRGTITLTTGQGWSNPEQEDFLFGLFALNVEFLSISVDNADMQITCNDESLTATDDDGNGIFDAGCSSTAPWTVEIKVGNIIERWHVNLAP